jgi:hypothetical protein
MCESTKGGRDAIPGPRAFGRRRGGVEGEDQGSAARVGSGLEAGSHPRVAGPGLDHGRCRKRHGYLPSGGSADRVALRAGLEAALGEDARPKQSKMLDAKQQAAIVAMVCAPPPPGRSRWTVVLIAEEATPAEASSPKWGERRFAGC